MDNGDAVAEKEHPMKWPLREAALSEGDGLSPTEPCAGWRAIWICVLAALSGWGVHGQSNEISGFSVAHDGRLRLECHPGPGFYVILLVGDTVRSISAPKDIQFGGDGAVHLRDPDLPWGSAFYRIKRVALGSPEDTDGDGMDDVYEMRHREVLHPLNPLDGSEDSDRDGRTNLEEYLRGTDPLRPESVVVADDIRFDSGHDYSVAIKSDGTLWAWGRNQYGQLGNGTTNYSNTPICVATNRLWRSVSAGLAHTMAVATDGSLWGWGWNSSGQLGDGTTTRRLLPVQVGTHRKWAAVSAGRESTVALSTDGSLWVWGYGLLGDGLSSTRLLPKQVAAERTWLRMSAADYHIVAVADDRTLWAWGYNGDGQLGDGTTTSRLRPVQVAHHRQWSAASAGGSMGSNQNSGHYWGGW